MKILAIHNIGYAKPQDESGVDIWRIWRPMRELAKQTGWQIDSQPSFIREIERFKDQEEFNERELENAAMFLGRYDIVYSSYYWNPTFYVLAQVVRDRYGTQFVLDIDDNMFAINEINPVWAKVGHDDVDKIQRIIRDTDWITTTTHQLKDEMVKRRTSKLASSIEVLPNAISADYPEYEPNNGDKVVVGYFGGSAHWDDLHETGLPKAIRDLMRAFPQVEFKTVGMPFDAPLPKSRSVYEDGIAGREWATKKFPTLNMDIVLGPLESNAFNESKSNIKWQEATRMGAAFVASNVGPYGRTLHHSLNCLLVNNTRRDWYDKIAYLIENPDARATLVRQAREDLAASYRLEDKWVFYKNFFERVKSESSTPADNVIK